MQNPRAARHRVGHGSVHSAGAQALATAPSPPDFQDWALGKARLRRGLTCLPQGAPVPSTVSHPQFRVRAVGSPAWRPALLWEATFSSQDAFEIDFSHSQRRPLRMWAGPGLLFARGLLGSADLGRKLGADVILHGGDPARAPGDPSAALAFQTVTPPFSTNNRSKLQAAVEAAWRLPLPAQRAQGLAYSRCSIHAFLAAAHNDDDNDTDDNDAQVLPEPVLLEDPAGAAGEIRQPASQREFCLGWPWCSKRLSKEPDRVSGELPMGLTDPAKA
ncbi:hypothetical protein H8959_007095 [Pygathrix nigripes]